MWCVCKARCGTAHATCEKENVCNISTESKAGKAPIAIFTSRERQNRAGRSGAGLGGGGRGIEKLQLLMVGSRRLRDLTNQESDKHAGKPGAFANGHAAPLFDSHDALVAAHCRRRWRRGRGAARLDLPAHLRAAPNLHRWRTRTAADRVYSQD